MGFADKPKHFSCAFFASQFQYSKYNKPLNFLPFFVVTYKILKF